ncbi:MAG: hypothetical protein HKP48_00460 [Winogradskyella sp.]|uniref:energy transducer TonB n=1 Tax=Winogradskyella sp. TaxID=1883156 RepID=UPI00182383B6|nr:energy transducer TonB [Winogradskyella sp.]MBT8245936.1 energy transducer TonB [Winogradskyella sp.]NNK21788.1 hypothetical protein [Winogradskyella sp.]
MTKYVLFVVIIFSFNFSFSQNEKEKQEEKILQIIKDVPIYKGCKKHNTATKKKRCMAKKIEKLVSSKFDTRVADNLKLSNSLISVIVTFNINTNGEVTDIKAKGPHKIVEDEAIRVISLIPKMRPGRLHGKAVTVPYTFPIKFIQYQ